MLNDSYNFNFLILKGIKFIIVVVLYTRSWSKHGDTTIKKPENPVLSQSLHIILRTVGVIG